MKSADRALRVLQTLARHARPMATMAIARECGVPKSSAHNLLNTMRAHGFVLYYPSEHAWGLGPSAFEVGNAFLRSGTLERIALPELVRLAEAEQVTCQLWVPVAADVMCIESVAPQGRGAVLTVRIGLRLPAGACAAGRAVLATLPLAQARMMPTEDWRHGRGELGLEEVRAAGHARDEGVLGPGVGSIAAAVVARDGLPLGALGVVDIVAEREPERMERLTRAVSGAASRLSAVLASGVGLMAEGGTLQAAPDRPISVSTAPAARVREPPPRP